MIYRFNGADFQVLGFNNGSLVNNVFNIWNIFIEIFSMNNIDKSTNSSYALIEINYMGTVHSTREIFYFGQSKLLLRVAIKFKLSRY